MNVVFGIAFVLGLLYIFEVAMFLRALKAGSESGWVAMGQPGLLDISKQVVTLAILLGFKALPTSASAATRAHLLVARITGLASFVLMMIVIVRETIATADW